MFRAQLHHLCRPFLVQILRGTPLSKSVLVRNVLSQVHSFRTSGAFPLILLWDCWFLLRAPCCRNPRTAYTQIQELQIPSIITYQTSQTASLHCTCWRQQQKFIGAFKLTDKNYSHPPNVQLGSILRMVSFQAHFSKWHTFSSVVLAAERTTRRSLGSLHLEIIYKPCTVSYHPAHQHVIRSNFCLVFH